MGEEGIVGCQVVVHRWSKWWLHEECNLDAGPSNASKRARNEDECTEGTQVERGIGTETRKLLGGGKNNRTARRKG